jgi:hypothetical protein
MTIQDAWGILRGDRMQLHNTLSGQPTPQLKEKFKPVIQNSLNKVSATKYYGDIVNTYNKIPFTDDVNPNLDEYATTWPSRDYLL